MKQVTLTQVAKEIEQKRAGWQVAETYRVSAPLASKLAWLLNEENPNWGMTYGLWKVEQNSKGQWEATWLMDSETEEEMESSEMDERTAGHILWDLMDATSEDEIKINWRGWKKF